MDLNFDITDGTGQHDGDPEFLDPHSFNGFYSDNKFPGGGDNYLTISGSAHPFLSSSETFHTPSLGDEEFEIPPISLDPDSALTVSDVVSHFGELSDGGPSGDVVVPGNAVVEGDDPSFASTFVSTSSQGLDHLSLGVMSQSGGSALLGMDLGHPMDPQVSSSSPVTIDVPWGDVSQGLLGSNQLTTIDQSELSAQLGLRLGGGNLLQQPASPDNPMSAAASPGSSMQVDDMDDFRRSVLVDSPLPLALSSGVISLDPSPSERDDPKNPKDPNEPQKPVSAYALFFRDTQAAIKGQNPNATFGEVSKIVASMWDSLGEEQKQVYKRKNEAAKKDYLKALAEYKSKQISQASIEVMDTSPSHPPPSSGPAPSHTTRSTRSRNYNPEENTITNICTSNIILDLPQVTTRSHTGAIKPPPQSSAPNPPTVAKLIIRRTPPASARQMPPLQQMKSTPPPPRLQQMVRAQAPPPLQAKPRGAPPPLQIKVVPATRQSDPAASIMVKSNVDATVSTTAVTVDTGDEVVESEDGMQVEVNVAPAPSIKPSSSPSLCVRAGCTNPAVESTDWDKEYCSNECVATHCRDVFMAWCAIRGQNSTSVT